DDSGNWNGKGIIWACILLQYVSGHETIDHAANRNTDEQVRQHIDKVRPSFPPHTTVLPFFLNRDSGLTVTAFARRRDCCLPISPARSRLRSGVAAVGAATRCGRCSTARAC